jgi:hypothetical protein
MPIPTSAYKTFADVSARLRTIVLDSEIAGGDTLTDPGSPTGVPFVTVQIINAAFEKVQLELARVGVETMIGEAWLIGLPAMPTIDPEGRMVVDDTGTTITYPNAIGNVFSLTPQLPVDLVLPLVLYERQTNTTNSPLKMRQPNGTLPSQSQSTWLINWEWETDGLRFRGATQSQDVKIKYEKSLPLLVATTDPVPIRGVVNAAAYAGATIFAQSRGGAISPMFKAEADYEISLLQQISARRRQRKQVRRQPYSGRGQRTNSPV